MLTWIGRGVLVGLLLAQSPDEDMASLEQDRLATINGSPYGLITIIARHVDGTPVRGYISCSGVWMKHEDGGPEEWALNLPFKTDSRGAIVMNPRIADEWIVCTSVDRGRRGTVLVEFSDANPVQVVEIILTERGEE